MRLLLFILIFCLIPFLCSGKSDYVKNQHVIYNVNKKDGYYAVNYTFLDHIGNLNEININYPINPTNNDIDKFGIPKSMLKPYRVTPEVESQRAKILKEGLFKLKGNNILIDFSAVVNYYAPSYCEPIANLLIDLLRKKGLDTRRHRIEMALKFVQDIPYAIPDNIEEKKFTGGALCPPQILINGYGDCDSKTLLFAGILSYMIDARDIVFVGVPNHMLAAVKSSNIPGGLYFEINGDEYYIAETAGPGRQAFGEKGKDFKDKANIEYFNFIHEVNVPETLHKIEFQPKDNKYYYIKLENKCTESMNYLVRYKDIKGNWIIDGWTELPKKELTKVYATQEKYFYLYATSKERIWQGLNRFEHEGKSYDFYKVTIDNDQSGDFTMRLGCK